jgi:hypothetical protein
MRKKELKLVVTFHTTADAMEMERICKMHGAPGRMIPVPRMLSAGCGMAWRADIADRETLAAVMREAGIAEEAMHEVMI